jgi:SAM-dependent methyltransferase
MSQPSDSVDSTIAYYDNNATSFCQDTLLLDMRELYKPFLALVPPGGRILDAGSGSGRDSLAFLNMGYEVLSIDASVEMVRATSNLTGQPAIHMSFAEFTFDNEFDGIWACASVLHVPPQELPSVLQTLLKAVKEGGPIYLSFKRGDSERMEAGRYFNDMDERSFSRLVRDQPELTTERLWTTKDSRPSRIDKCWLNAILRKTSAG